VRSGLGSRARLLRSGCAGLTARAGVAFAAPVGAGLAARPITPTADGELGLAGDFGLGARCSVSVFAEVSGLLDTDLSNTRSGVFLQGVAGVEWAPWGPLSLIARAGKLRRMHTASLFAPGGAPVVTGGAAVRF
jgi:hypothetical protein